MNFRSFSSLIVEPRPPKATHDKCHAAIASIDQKSADLGIALQHSSDLALYILARGAEALGFKNEHQRIDHVAEEGIRALE